MLHILRARHPWCNRCDAHTSKRLAFDDLGGGETFTPFVLGKFAAQWLAVREQQQVMACVLGSRHGMAWCTITVNARWHDDVELLRIIAHDAPNAAVLASSQNPGSITIHEKVVYATGREWRFCHRTVSKHACVKPTQMVTATRWSHSYRKARVADKRRARWHGTWCNDVSGGNGVQLSCRGLHGPHAHAAVRARASGKCRRRWCRRWCNSEVKDVAW